MKFKTADLIARIDRLMREIEGEMIDRAEKLDAEQVGALDAWIEDHADAFLMFAERIKYHLNRNQPITAEHIPKDIKGRSNTDLKFYFPPTKGRPLAEERRYENLRKLRNALCASQEDTVTPTAIKQLGFQDVTFLFTQEAAK